MPSVNGWTANRRLVYLTDSATGEVCLHALLNIIPTFNGPNGFLTVSEVDPNFQLDREQMLFTIMLMCDAACNYRNKPIDPSRVMTLREFTSRSVTVQDMINAYPMMA
jgi:hypothetical protein